MKMKYRCRSLLPFVAFICFVNIFGPFYFPAQNTFPPFGQQNLEPSPSTASLLGPTELVKRRVPLFDIHRIKFQLLPSSVRREHYQWTVHDNNASVLIEGTSLSSLTLGLGSFYRLACSTELLSWADATRPTRGCFQSPPRLLSFHSYANFPLRYAWNQVTFSYSTTWWTWQRYEQELDWLALRGVNLLLAHEGQEYLYRLVFQELCPFGYRDSYFTHEAYFAWNRMGNIQNVGAKPSLPYMKSRHHLQLDILKRMQELGISPVLPAFNGFAPCSSATIEPKTWSGFSVNESSVPRVPLDSPLFRQLARRLIAIQLETYGQLLESDGGTLYFSSDSFNENPATTEDFSLLVKALVDAPLNVPKLMGYRNEVRIVLQLWFLAHDWQYWTRTRARRFLSAFPDNSLLLLDLHGEKRSQIGRLSLASLQQQVVFCVLHNFGGGGGMGGEVDVVLRAIELNRNVVVGVGIAPEGIEQNEVVYDSILLHAAWGEEREFPLLAWLCARYRVSSLPETVLVAWQRVFHSVYSRKRHYGFGTTKSVWEVRPILYQTIHSDFQPTTIEYSPDTMLLAALNVGEVDSLAFQRDVVDFTRQLLSDMALLIMDQLEHAVGMEDDRSVRQASELLLSVLNLTGLVLSSHVAFCFQAQPREYIPLTETQQVHRRELLTYWSAQNEDGALADYGSKQLGGSLFYRVHLKRWAYLLELGASLRRGVSKAYARIEREWVHANNDDMCDFTLDLGAVLPAVHHVAREVLLLL